MRLAVIGDIHANAVALRAALVLTDRAGFDLRIFLGDLLTYGVEVTRTLDLVAEAACAPRNVLLRGNHDEVYDRMLAGGEAVAGWVGQHMRWTAPQIAVAAWRELPFQHELRLENLLLAHANPFGAGDWSYLNTVEEHVGAAAVLADRGLRWGVFGHTHRAKLFSARAAAFLEPRPEWRRLFPGGAVVNAGSVGQPRSDHPGEVVLWIETGGPTSAVAFEPLRYDLGAHRRAINASDLPEEIRARCLAYHRPR
jgi:predicted phosphodiesterase